MSKSRRARPQVGAEHEVVIDRLAYGGSGVGRVRSDEGPGMVVFVPRAAPGDRLRVRVEKVRKRHAEAALLEVIEPGAARVEPPCPHYDEGCGGCTWQHLGYAAQVAAKQDLVRDSLERIGGFADLPLLPIVPADEPWWYRNKMDFSFHAQDGLGLHRSGDWRRVVEITDCRLESALAMKILDAARTYARVNRVEAWDPVESTGYLRELHVRHGRNTGQTMVGLVTAPGELPAAAEFAAAMTALDPSIVSLLHGIRADSDGSPILSVETIAGRDSIEESVGGLTFEIGLQTFFQTSTRQAERMFEIVRRQVTEGLAGLGVGDGPTLAIDVFCGVGFFTLGLADLVDHAAGVEIVEPSILAARDNARRNGIDNVSFYAGDARRTLPVMIEKHGDPAIVVLDPPRGGTGGKVMRRIARSRPGRIVYVSCNPTTLARDLKEVVPFGYAISEVQVIDLFPQTYHVETIVALDFDETRVTVDEKTAQR